MAVSAQLTVKRDEQKGKIWSYLRSKWKNETPEERVRQSLHNAQVGVATKC